MTFARDVMEGKRGKILVVSTSTAFPAKRLYKLQLPTQPAKSLQWICLMEVVLAVVRAKFALPST